MKAEKKVQKKKSDVVHVYYVTDIQFWRVIIMRYQLVKKTAKFVMVLDGSAKQIRLVPNDADGIVCDDFEEARKLAKARIKEKKKLLKKYGNELDDSAGEIAMRKVRDVKPIKIDLSKLKEEDYKF